MTATQYYDAHSSISEFTDTHLREKKMAIEKGTMIVVRPGDPTYEASRLKGFRDRWVIAREYEIKDGVLAARQPPSPTQGWWRDSYPAVQQSIPAELANIQEGDETALLALARKYGLLGFTHLLPFSLVSLYGKKLITEEELLSSEGFHHEVPEKERLRIARDFVRGERESLAKLSQECGLPDKNMWKVWVESGGGDPLPWVWAHIRTLKFCMDLGDLIENEYEQRLISFLRQYQSPYSKDSKALHPVLEVGLQHTVTLSGHSQPPNLTVFEFAEILRQRLINENIRDIHSALQSEGSRQRKYFQFRSLIEMAYWHLSDSIEGGTLKRCKRKGCGNFFIQTHGGTEFCPEPKTPKGESRCAVLHRGKAAKKTYREKLRRKGKSQR